MVMLGDMGNMEQDYVVRSSLDFRHRQKKFQFDMLFDLSATQRYVFEKSTLPLVKPVLNGFNSTVFAYGATGAGKTFTMIGSKADPGIMYHTMNEIFDQIEQEQGALIKYNVHVSFLEIYNENIRDLIVPSNHDIAIKEDQNHGVKVTGISNVSVTTANEILELLVVGNSNRVQEATMANETSSRSHAVLQIAVEKIYNNKVKLGKFSLIDLAGSERASKTQNQGVRL
jgi:kinesin family protein 18/19